MADVFNPKEPSFKRAVERINEALRRQGDPLASPDRSRKADNKK
jgi:hypothetical protein